MCLKPGDRIRLVSPAGTSSEEGVHQIAPILDIWGLRVELGERVDHPTVGSDLVNSSGGTFRETPITCDVIEIIPPMSESRATT